MKKKISTVLLTTVLAFSSISAVQAQTASTNVVVNDPGGSCLSLNKTWKKSGDTVSWGAGTVAGGLTALANPIGFAAFVAVVVNSGLSYPTLEKSTYHFYSYWDTCKKRYVKKLVIISDKNKVIFNYTSYAD